MSKGRATVPTYTARIFVGLWKHDTPITHQIERGHELVRRYVDHVGLCVTFGATEFIYTGGGEPGFVVEFINYPRLPSTREEIREKAFALAEILKEQLNQFRVSVVFPDETVMLGE